MSRIGDQRAGDAEERILRSAQNDGEGNVAAHTAAPRNAEWVEDPKFSIPDFQFSIDFPPAWDALLGCPFDRQPYRSTLRAAEAAALLETVYPPRADWFAAFRLTPPERVRVVILGQDPYHAPEQAMGLAFSVREGMKLPPSLRNIYRELEADLGVPAPSSGNLTAWAEQGVLLLNTVLTVAAGRANSHKNFGWQRFTDAVLAAVSRLPQPIAFVLWGAPAQKAFEHAAGTSIACSQASTNLRGSTDEQCSSPQAAFVAAHSDAPRETAPRLVLTAPHPSPLSAYRGFFGSRPFSRINAFLRANGEAPISWVTSQTEPLGFP